MGVPAEGTAIACQPGASVQKTAQSAGQKSGLAGGNANSNTVNINWQPPAPAHPAENTTSHVEITPQPLKLTVDTSTDWAAVGATGSVGMGSIVVSLVVAWVARGAVREQTKASTANIRKEWQAELRRAFSRFFAAAELMHILSVKEFKADTESNKLAELLEARTMILLLMGPMPEATRAKEYMAAIIESLTDDDFEKLKNARAALIELASAVVEQAWQDIQRDIGVKN